MLRALLAQLAASVLGHGLRLIWLTLQAPTLSLLHGTSRCRGRSPPGVAAMVDSDQLPVRPCGVVAAELELAPQLVPRRVRAPGSAVLDHLRSRVPLYLSSREACERLAQLLPSSGGFKVLDLGCGFGGLLAGVARTKPGAQLHGVEIAPLPALVAWFRLRGASATAE